MTETTPTARVTSTTHHIELAVTDQPDVPNKYGSGSVRPRKVRLTYRDDRIRAQVYGPWVHEDGTLTGEPCSQPYIDDLSWWPDWLAALAREHQPAPADRAAVLREVAARIDRTDLPQDQVDMFDNGARWATSLLRRMAAEARS